MATTRLSKTFSSAGNRRTFTLSAWIKRSKIGSAQTFGLYKQEGGGGGNNYLYVGYFNSSDKLYLARNQSATEVEVITNRVFRDTNSWYHIVIAIDTTQGTASDRVKCWVNGVQETSFATANYPSQNQQFDFNVAQTHYLGSTFNGTSDNFDGLISHMHFCDGYSYQATAFGETDSTTGEWKIKTNVSVSYGTNGFFFFKDGTNLSGSTVQDQSGQGNNWTVAGGTLTKTEDNPSNVFDTLNANISQAGGVGGRDANIRPFLEYGNTVSSTDVALWTQQMGSIPMTAGKYYFEMRRAFAGSPSNHLAFVGIEEISTAGTGMDNTTGQNTDGIGYYSAGSVKKSGSTQSGTFATWQSNNDIVQVAIDLDNNFIYFGKNGVWQNSGNPESGGSGTGGIAITAGKTFISSCTVHRGGGSSGGSKTWLQLNYGNGYFAENAISSAGTNASGNGIFEYNVPAGYTALSTKGLNS